MIREATPADAAALAALHTACFDEAWSTGAMLDLLALEGAFALVAEEGGMRGFALARVAGGEGEILSIGVHPLTRRSGLGAVLLRAAMLHAADVGAAEMFLEVAVDNVAALGLYTALGFLHVGRRKDYYDRGAAPAADALILRAALPLAGGSGTG